MNATSWDEIRAMKTGQIDDRDRLAALVELSSTLAAYRLADIRKARDLTQTDVSRSMNVGQRRVSAIESAELARTEIGTVASYVEALGGHLRLIADFGDDDVVIVDSGRTPKSSQLIPSPGTPAPARQ